MFRLLSDYLYCILKVKTLPLKDVSRAEAAQQRQTDHNNNKYCNQ